MKLKRFFPLITIVTLLTLPACLGNNEATDYSSWMNLNTRYYDSIALLTEDGNLVYREITPEWDRSFSILMKWHNNPNENESDITPLSNSTCDVSYTLTNIAGDTLDSSASYSCIPNQMSTGFMAALTNMKVNDTVTAVIPYAAGYGAYGSGGVRPYSTLIFGIRLKNITKLM